MSVGVTNRNRGKTVGATILPIANQKGGVGKTTTALSLGAALVRLKKKVLIVDLDPHANASIHMAFFPEKLKYTVLDLFLSKGLEPDIWDRIIYPDKGSGFDFVPSHIRLSELEVDLKDKPGKGLILRKALEAVSSEYDYVLLDCPPHVGIILVNALVAGDLLIIPIQTDFLALHGVRLIFDTIRTLSKALGRPIRFRALATMYDQRASACRRVLDILSKKMPDRLFKSVISMDTKFREASAQGQVIFDIDPKCSGAKQYLQLAKEIIAHENS